MSKPEIAKAYERLNLESFEISSVDSLRKTLGNILANSDEQLIKNTIQETHNLLDKAKQDSITYKRKSEIFSEITDLLLSLWRHYKNVPEAVELMVSIDDATNLTTAYCRLYHAFSLINENKTGDSLRDGEKVVTGFHLLSQTVDTYINHISNSELKQIYQHAKNILISSKLEISDYLKESLENSNLVTQLRAYCSLIVLRIEDYCDRQEINLEIANETPTSSQPWWEKIAGTMSDDPTYNEALKLGKEYRESFRPKTK